MLSIVSKPYFYRPSNLDLPALLAEYGEGKWLGKDLWRLYYILTVIYRKRWEEEWSKERFVPLNAKVLQDVLHCHKSRPSLDVLVKTGVIEMDSRFDYQVGVKSRRFRFTERYSNVRFCEVTGLDLSRVSRRLLYGEALLSKLEPEHRYIYCWLKRTTLADEVLGVLSKTTFDSVTQQDFYERSVEMIQKKQFSFSVGRISGRVFNNVTNLPRGLRPFLRIDGRPLAEIDISASQPLLLSQLYAPDEWERLEYLEMVLSGQFYERLNAKLVKPYKTRDDIKEGVFREVFFGRIRPHPRPLSLVFSEMFPVLSQKVVEAKTPHYKALSHRLQRAESEIVIQGAVGRLMQSNIPVLTVHDSILTFPEHCDCVKTTLKNAVGERLGIVAKITVKPYSGFRGTDSDVGQLAAV